MPAAHDLREIKLMPVRDTSGAMAQAAREVWITGTGLVSSLGEGSQAHWQALEQGRVAVDTKTFAPYVVHPLAPLDFEKQIPKRNLRQMERWQRIGAYAAALALEDAGVKDNPELLSRMDMVVATGTGERDIPVEDAILAELPAASDPAAFLNQRLTNDLRPRLFLAQLPNLLAGFISILYGVAGSSRTLMGEESAGIDAVRLAHTRIAAGQSEIALVGGAHAGERKDMLLVYEFGGFNLKDAHAPVWQRGPRGGFALGSLGAFLVLESREHAQRRGARPLARLSTVLSQHSEREEGALTPALGRMWNTLRPQLQPEHCAVISGASGAEPATGNERQFLAAHAGVPVRATGTYIGHCMEPQFPMNIALAALAVKHGGLFPPEAGSGVEAPFAGRLRQAVVTGVGHWRGEGMALVEALDEGD
jgi:3-oxoacyl-[acyl-carrier-protein] synthase II